MRTLPDRCPTCRQFDFMDKHTCPPRWRAWFHDEDDTSDPDGGRIVWAKTAEDAAKKMVHDCNDEGQYVDVDTLVLVMREGPDGPVGAEQWFTVRGEVSVDFTVYDGDAPADHKPFA